MKAVRAAGSVPDSEKEKLSWPRRLWAHRLPIAEHSLGDHQN